jgi:hypothetical protein
MKEGIRRVPGTGTGTTQHQGMITKGPIARYAEWKAENSADLENLHQTTTRVVLLLVLSALSAVLVKSVSDELWKQGEGRRPTKEKKRPRQQHPVAAWIQAWATPLSLAVAWAVGILVGDSVLAPFAEIVVVCVGVPVAVGGSAYALYSSEGPLV